MIFDFWFTTRNFVKFWSRDLARDVKGGSEVGELVTEAKKSQTNLSRVDKLSLKHCPTHCLTLLLSRMLQVTITRDINSNWMSSSRHPSDQHINTLQSHCPHDTAFT